MTGSAGRYSRMHLSSNGKWLVYDEDTDRCITGCGVCVMLMLQAAVPFQLAIYSESRRQAAAVMGIQCRLSKHLTLLR